MLKSALPASLLELSFSLSRNISRVASELCLPLPLPPQNIDEKHARRHYKEKAICINTI